MTSKLIKASYSNRNEKKKLLGPKKGRKSNILDRKRMQIRSEPKIWDWFLNLYIYWDIKLGSFLKAGKKFQIQFEITLMEMRKVTYLVLMSSSPSISTKSFNVRTDDAMTYGDYGANCNK